MNPLVSVIMPVYNSENYVSDAINSILNQTYQNWELIIIDDGSTDKSGAICEQFSCDDSRIQIVHKKNEGMCAARNQGIRLATGKYIYFMDNDDICKIHLLEEAVSALEKSNADMVKFGRQSEIVDSDMHIYRSDKRLLELKQYNSKYIKENFLQLRSLDIFNAVWDGLYKRDLIIKENIFFDESLRYGEEDTIFCMQLAAKSSCIITIPGCFFFHYVRLKHSASSKYSIQSLDKYRISINAMRSILSKIMPHYETNPYYVECLCQNYILSVLLQLNYKTCTMTFREKMLYLETMGNEEIFFFPLSYKLINQLIDRNKKQAIVFILWKLKRYRLLYFITKIYFKENIHSMGE